MNSTSSNENDASTTTPVITTFFVTTYNPDEQPVGSLPSNWTANDLNTIGILLWLAIVVALVGNIACFYAVCKNIKKILEHPFFQSNILCILLSAADVMLVLLVGIPAALFFCTANDNGPRGSFLNKHLGNAFYNLAIIDPLLDYFVWLQLLLIVAICLDRTGHILKPLTYTFSIKTSGTALACFMCLLIPFVLQTIPYIVMVEQTIAQNIADMTLINCEPGDSQCVLDHSFRCGEFGNIQYEEIVGRHLFKKSDTKLFLTCTVALPSNRKDGEARLTDLHKIQWWESVSHPLMLFLAATALILSNCLIIYKLVKSSRFRRSNMSRPSSIKKEDMRVTRMIQLNSMVACVQAVLLVASTLPLRIFQIEDKLHTFYLDKCVIEENKDKYYCRFNKSNYHERYLLIAKVLVFLGPMLNPWLYPIRMASIRTFFAAKKQSLASSARRLTLSSRASTFRLKRSKKNKYVSITAEDQGHVGREYHQDQLEPAPDCGAGSDNGQNNSSRRGGEDVGSGKNTLITLINGDSLSPDYNNNSNQYTRL